MVTTRELHVKSQGDYDVIDITDAVARAVKEADIIAGTVTIFCPGSTAGVTTLEFESGVVHDLQQVLDEITPLDREYLHHLRWHDDNGHSHIRAALIGPSLTVPIVGKRLTLGTWQQIVVCDFDTSPRTRTLILQMMGE